MLSLSNRNHRLLVLGAIVLLAFFLRLHRAGTYGIYFDEKSTLLISQGVALEGANQRDVFTKPYFTPQEFWKPKTLADFVEANIRGDIGNSPAYYAVLWLWMQVFGLGDLAIRLPSVIFSTLTVLLLYLFVKRHFGSNPVATTRLALVSCGIAAVEPFFISYSHMARNYSMTFFLTLLATHVFLLLMKRETAFGSRREGFPTGLYISYGLLFILSVLSHYLTVTVFLCHGLYALLFLRKRRTWLALSVTAVSGLLLISLWFIYGGGKYTFFTLNYQAKFYRNLALTNPKGSQFGTILPATLPNITQKAVPIFADLFIFTNGLGATLLGIRNTLLALVLGLVATGIIHRYRNQRRPPVWVQWALPLLLLAGLPVYSVVPFRFLILSAAVPFFYLMGRAILRERQGSNRQLLVLLLLLSFVPTLFLLFMSWRSGHTYGITQRYSGFSFPYVIILVALTLRQLAGLRYWFSVPLALVLLVQLVFVGQLLHRIYRDAEPKYTYFSKPRIANPYLASAEQLKRLYAPGDTILYPNMKRPIYSDIDKTYSPVSLLDAQLINVYLPPNAQYVQRIDPAEPDKIVLVKGSTGKKITIFDFKGTTYRY